MEMLLWTSFPAICTTVWMRRWDKPNAYQFLFWSSILTTFFFDTSILTTYLSPFHSQYTFSGGFRCDKKKPFEKNHEVALEDEITD